MRSRRSSATPAHPPGAASQQSPRACVSSSASWSSLARKPYLRADHFKGGGSWRTFCGADRHECGYDGTLVSTLGMRLFVQKAAPQLSLPSSVGPISLLEEEVS